MKTGYQDKKCGLIGEKLGHSFSGMIHNELADYSFSIREVAREELESFVHSEELDAYCVTIPYKKEIMPFLDEISPEAADIGAVNVVVRGQDKKLRGYNTDYFGFEYMIDSAKIDVSGKKAIVFGKGGASATVCTVLRDKGVRELITVGREENTQKNLSKHCDADIIVNATPVGMYPNNYASPVDISLFPKCQAVLDIVYNPARTQLMIEAEKRGIIAVGGLSMLVAQAAKGFEYFTGDTKEDGCIERITSLVAKNTGNIVLIGMPGCGKTTVGKIVATNLGRTFFDADSEFTATYGFTPAEAIKSIGEEEFRSMESRILAELGKKSGAVIATGGGAVTRECNYDPLHQNGVIVLIERDLDKLSTRGRPLSMQCSVQELYAKRADAYFRFADTKVKSAEHPCDTANAVVSAVEKYYFKK